MCLGVEHTGHSFCAAFEHAGKLVHGNRVVVPCELIRAGRGSTGGEIVEVCAHGERPCVIETLDWIGTSAEPFCRDGRLFGRISKQFFLTNPALLVGLRGEGTGGVIGQLHLAGVARQRRGLIGRDVEKHLVGCGGDDMHGSITHLHLRPCIMRRATEVKAIGGREIDRAFGDDGFKTLYGFLIG